VGGLGLKVEMKGETVPRLSQDVAGLSEILGRLAGEFMENHSKQVFKKCLGINSKHSNNISTVF
jgi:hypothetical protein